MVGKITTVLIKKEAEAYRVQGLHQEALSLYDHLLSSSPNIDPALKEAIKSQIEGICEDLQTFASKRSQPLSINEILRIKEGWGDSASEADIMVCAQAFCQIGAFKDALEEFRKLLKAGCAPVKLAGSVAQCLAQLHSANDLPDAADQLVADALPCHDASLLFELLLAKFLAAKGDKQYALQYYKHLTTKPYLPPDVAGRIHAVIAKYEKSYGRTQKAATPVAPQNAPDGSKKKFFRRIFK
jgi:tetratricopeptide (TPR) repeat protein